MASTKMMDYFKTTKKREIQFSSKSQAPIGTQAASNKKLYCPVSDSFAVGKQPWSPKNGGVKQQEKTTVGLDGRAQEKALSKKRKLSSDDVVSSPKQTKLEENGVATLPTVEPTVPSEEIAAKDIKKCLKKPGNAEKIAQMRESLQKINKISDKLTQIRKPTTECVRPTVSVSVGEKAFQRHHSLASEEAVKLGLPYKYKVLAEIFKCLDSVVSVMHNRHEICDFKKLKPAIQQMLRRTFNLSHLGQIAAVFPNGFIFKQEKVHSYEVEGKVFNYQLTVYPNFDCFTNGASNTFDAKQNCHSDTKEAVHKRPFRSMTPNFLVSRQKFFFDSLLSAVKKQHEEFLSRLTPPIKLSSEKLIRWHPQFKLDQALDIMPAPLPEPENVETYSTAKDVLAKVRGLYNSQIDNALETVASKSSNCHLQERIDMPKPAKSTTVKGIPLALLEKIRAKEVAQIKANITRNPANELKLAMMAQLPEVSRIVRNLFIAEKRAAISYSLAVTKVVESAVGSVSLSEMERNIVLLVELIPEWLSVIEIRNCKFLKINKLINFNDVIAKLENEKKIILQSR